MRILKTQRSSRGGGRRNSKKFGSGRSHVSSRAGIFRTCSGSSGDEFSEKLQALKSLLPSSETNKPAEQNLHVEEKADSGETEQLFQETADYIVRLRSQVVVLQKLIEIYGSSSSDKTEDFVL